MEQAARFPPSWLTCEAVLAETFHLVGGRGIGRVASLLRRGILICSDRFADDRDAVLKLLERYSQVPMGLCRCLPRSDDRNRERSHVAVDGCRLPNLPAPRSADDSVRAPALTPRSSRNAREAAGVEFIIHSTPPAAFVTERSRHGLLGARRIASLVNTPCFSAFWLPSGAPDSNGAAMHPAMPLSVDCRRATWPARARSRTTARAVTQACRVAYGEHAGAAAR
jgi:hypothetical protein